VVACALIAGVWSSRPWEDGDPGQQHTTDFAQRLRQVNGVYIRGYLQSAEHKYEAALATLAHAERQMRALVAEYPETHHVWWLRSNIFMCRGVCLDRLERTEEALPLFDESIRSRRRVAELEGRGPPIGFSGVGAPYAQRAGALWTVQRHAEAEVAYREAIRLIEAEKAVAEIHFASIAVLFVARRDLGFVLREVGREKDARTSFRGLIEWTDMPFAILVQSWALADCPDESIRNPTAAVALAKRALELEGHKVAGGRMQCLHALGHAQFRAGNDRAALDALEKSMALSNGGGGGHWYLAAMAQWRLGNREEAIALFDRRETSREINWFSFARPDLDRLRAEAAAMLGIEKAGG
jgi:tetratricopeptide (TPR) repeat protein